jgi:hypothetical protein
MQMDFEKIKKRLDGFVFYRRLEAIGMVFVVQVCPNREVTTLLLENHLPLTKFR